ncbi:nose resistant to fluoxetine protein 6-like isoform X2 [Varroa jacobsoni]|nr:nose resistant to fluoxetine protein 6-like isoform X2 [Varroa jacobsoni]
MLPSIVDSSYLRVRIRFGVCVPSTCETEELNALISHVANKYEYESEVSGCRTLADESERTPTFYVAICTFGCLVILVALSTTAEHLQWGKSGDFSCVFSLISNNKHLFAATTEKNQALAFLNGVKALLSFWIVLGHTYFMVDAYTIYTLKEAYDAMKSVFAQFVITGAFLGVTTFFCISGFLFTRGLISYKGPSIPAVFIYVVFMVRRYVRLTVPSAAVILFGYIMRAWVNGPTADGAFRVYTEACDTNWWRIFALANNFATLENMCWYHYWFMSVDMQIFSVALVFALMMPRRPKLAITILVLCALYSCIWIIDTSHRNKLQAAPIINENWAQLSRFLYLMYVKAFTHFNACVIGLLAGFVYVKAYDMYISKTVQCVSAVLCFVVMVTMILATLPFYYYIPVPRYIELFYAGFHRIVWSVAVSWLFFLMGTNRMQWLSRTLSLRLFVVLGRLSFSTYLIHVPLLTYYMGINTVYVQIEHSKMLRTAIGNYVISVALAYILHMMVEAPTMQVEARLFRFIKKAEMKQAQNDNKNPDLHLSDVKVHSATKL